MDQLNNLQNSNKVGELERSIERLSTSLEFVIISINEVKTMISEKDKQINSNENKFSEILSRILNIEKLLDKFGPEISTIQNKIVVLETNHNNCDKSDCLENLEEELRDLKEIVSNLTNKQNSVEHRVTGLEDRNNKIDSFATNWALELLKKAVIYTAVAVVVFYAMQFQRNIDKEERELLKNQQFKIPAPSLPSINIPSQLQNQ